MNPTPTQQTHCTPRIVRAASTCAGVDADAKRQAMLFDHGAAAPHDGGATPDELRAAIDGITDRAGRGDRHALDGLCRLTLVQHRVRPDSTGASDDGNRVQLKVIAGIDADLL